MGILTKYEVAQNLLGRAYVDHRVLEPFNYGVDHFFSIFSARMKHSGVRQNPDSEGFFVSMGLGGDQYGPVTLVTPHLLRTFHNNRAGDGGSADRYGTPPVKPDQIGLIPVDIVIVSSLGATALIQENPDNKAKLQHWADVPRPGEIVLLTQPDEIRDLFPQDILVAGDISKPE